MATTTRTRARGAKASQADASTARRRFTKGLQSLPDNYVLCRDVRHKWDVREDYHQVPFTHEGREVKAMRRVLACDRCPCTRTQHFVVGRYGMDKLDDRYWRPKDYTVPGIPRGVAVQSVVQQETYRRAMERATGSARGERATAER